MRTNTSSDLHDNRRPCCSRVVKLLLRQHEGCVAILAGVAVVVEPGHEDDAVHTHLPLRSEHDASFPPERVRRGRLPARGLGFEELLGLGETDANKTDTNRDGSYEEVVRN